ncbi:hypothetical protein [Aequorivita lipolytica]|uniref:Lipocalin-like domain-containing protein n=1 Tax=Aequorivita lipolytica TaxID=153267 RepID=A0A5C6YRG3_9FLAO|nr:hypothetical protein [Aequorivita lipolytica]TXD70108.1 hypothetical protein ESV24_02750 [Aequorivita lipolytica]SRX50518.1 hypothetical protein AEQU2_00991 [Aequorivita lipolytica]
MKFAKLIFLFVLTIAAIGCSKDDDNGPAPYEYTKDNLTGTYKITFFESREVETVNVSGFDVVTTTSSIGDTFNVSSVFASNNTVTIDGTYRITETVTQGSQSNTETYIVDIDNETSGYSANAATAELTIDGSTYKVSNFNPTGFTISLSETTTEPNGDNSVYTEELRFTKQ